MDNVIKEFKDECFMKDVNFSENSVYDNFYILYTTQHHRQ